MFVGLTTGRPSAKDLFSNDVLQTWITATNIRLRMIQTKTMLGHLMSVAQGDRTVTRRVRKQLKMCDQDIRLLTVRFLPIIYWLNGYLKRSSPLIITSKRFHANQQLLLLLLLLSPVLLLNQGDFRWRSVCVQRPRFRLPTLPSRCIHPSVPVSTQHSW